MIYDENPRRVNLSPDPQHRPDLEMRGLALMQRGIIPLSLWAGLDLADQPSTASSE